MAKDMTDETLNPADSCSLTMPTIDEINRLIAGQLEYENDHQDAGDNYTMLLDATSVAAQAALWRQYRAWFEDTHTGDAPDLESAFGHMSDALACAYEDVRMVSSSKCDELDNPVDGDGKAVPAEWFDVYSISPGEIEMHPDDNWIIPFYTDERVIIGARRVERTAAHGEFEDRCIAHIQEQHAADVTKLDGEALRYLLTNKGVRFHHVLFYSVDTTPWYAYIHMPSFHEAVLQRIEDNKDSDDD